MESNASSAQPTPAPRVPLKLDIEYRRSYARNSSSGIVKNISLTGAFLETPMVADLATRDKLVIVFTVAGRTRKINATVVWTNTLGVGLKFHHFNNRDIQIIDDLIYFVESSRNERRDVLDTIFKKVV